MLPALRKMAQALPFTRSQSLIATLENHFFSSAPALSETVNSSGWLIRSSGGYTKRGNSASPLNPKKPFDQSTLADITSGLRSPHVMRITPLAHPGDDELRERLGWRHLDPSIVMTRTLSRPPANEDSYLQTSVSSVPPPEWVDGFATSSSLSPSHTATFQGTLDLIRHPFIPSYLTLTDPSTSQEVAYGQAVRSGDIVGLFNIVVPKAHRGKGYGRKFTQALLNHGAEEGAGLAYLQVTEGNAVGRRLYESMGFSEEYRYHYRVAP